jgi:hypothetical protein
MFLVISITSGCLQQSVIFKVVGRNNIPTVLSRNVINSKVVLYKIDYIYDAHNVLKFTVCVEQVQYLCWFLHSN